MKIVMFVCCETCVQDVRTNVLSLFNIIDEISAVTFPIALAKFTSVAMATKTDIEPDVIPSRLKCNINGNVVFDLDFTFEFQGKQRTRLIAEFQSILLPMPGIFHVSVNDAATGSEFCYWDILVQQVGAPQMTLFTSPQGATQNPTTP